MKYLLLTTNSCHRACHAAIDSSLLFCSQDPSFWGCFFFKYLPTLGPIKYFTAISKLTLVMELFNLRRGCKLIKNPVPEDFMSHLSLPVPFPSIISLTWRAMGRGYFSFLQLTSHKTAIPDWLTEIKSVQTMQIWFSPRWRGDLELSFIKDRYWRLFSRRSCL